MNLFSKPKNRWGWVRIGGYAVLALMLVWTALAAAFTWWTGWKVFSLLDRFELAVIPLLAVVVGQWLEEHDHRVETEHSDRREAELAAEEKRKEVLLRFRYAMHEINEEDPEAARPRMEEAVRAALAELDAKGRGELLHWLYEQGLLRAENLALHLTGADFSAAVLHKPHLSGICLDGADLTAAQLDGAHLGKSRLAAANLNKAFLRRADLREAALTGSTLTLVHLEHANLEGADLTGAVLRNSLLNHANLKHAVVSPEALEEAVLVETILPDGRKLTNAKGKEYLEKKEIATLVDRL